MRTKIIAATPGCGKTYASEHLDNAIDLEYSHYAWVRENGKKVMDLKGERIHNFAFPKNYIDNIKACIGEFKYIFIGTHDIVLRELIKEGIPFTVVIPELSMRDIWFQRFKDRNDDEHFISIQEQNWTRWVQELKYNKENYEQLIEIKDEYLIDIIRRLEKM